MLPGLVLGPPAWAAYAGNRGKANGAAVPGTAGAAAVVDGALAAAALSPDVAGLLALLALAPLPLR